MSDTFEVQVRTGARYAKDLLLTYGWKQGAYGSMKDGFCLVGAIITIEKLDVMNEIQRRCARVVGHMHVISPPLAEWNDRKTRKKRDVLRVLSAVAAGKGALRRGKHP